MNVVLFFHNYIYVILPLNTNIFLLFLEINILESFNFSKFSFLMISYIGIQNLRLKLFVKKSQTLIVAK